MAVIDWPASLVPDEAEFWLESHSLVHESGFSRSMQVLDLGFPRWRGRARFTSVGRRGALLDATLARISGPQNLVRIWNYGRPLTESGTHIEWASGLVAEPWSDGTWFVDGSGNQTGWLATGRPTTVTAAALQWATSVSVDGLAPGRTYYPGEHFGASDGTHERVYMLVEEVTADANGQGTLSFRPPLRGPLAEDAELNMTRPTCPFRLVDDQQSRHTMRPPKSKILYSHEIEFVEDLTEVPAELEPAE